VPRWPEREWIEALRETLKDSVRIRLRSDVPVGTCLSGGLDSSSLITLVSQLVDGRPAAFSVVYDDEGFTEGRFIQAMGDRLPLDLHVVKPTGDDLFDVMAGVVWHNDEPSSSYGMYSQWQVMKLAAEHGVTVILNGQGGDELLAGYHRYMPTYIRELLRAGHLVRAARELRGSLLRQDIDVSQNLKQAVYPLLPGLARRAWRRAFSERPRLERFLRPEFVEAARPASVEAHRADFDTLAEHLMHDLCVASVPELVHHEDRCSMAFSREVRLPFLDHRLVELVVRMPASLKIRDGVTKYVLRAMMAPEGLPPEILTRYDKKGYPTPMGRWFATTAREGVHDVLASAAFRTRGIVDQERALQAFARHVAGEYDFTQLIWQWLTLELWFRQFIDSPEARH
jgi:asparagine synthase (glutamine-hydrolysing)